LLVDCNALLYRGHYAMSGNPLMTADGMNTSGLFFLLRQLLDRRDARSPHLVAAVFDHPGPSFRVDIYPEYKSNRPPMPEELRLQSEYARKVIPALGIPLVERKGLEADDIIAWFAREAEKAGDRVEILSSDKDLLQLVSDRVTVIRPGGGRKKESIIRPEDVEAVMGVKADQVADFLALTGDSSDNVPGVAGIGRKTAAALLGEYGDLEGIYAALDEIKTSLRKKLEAGKEMAMLSRRLVSLPPPVEPGISLYSLKPSPPIQPDAGELLSKLGMASIAERLGVDTVKNDLFGSAGIILEDRQPKVRIIRTSGELRDVNLGEDPVAIDTETTSKDPMEASPVGLSMASAAGVWYVPLGGACALEAGEVVEILGEKLSGRRIVGQNGKFDMHVLENLGLRLDELGGDPMIADYLLNPEIQSHSLSSMAARWLGIRLREYREVLGNASTLLEVETEKVAAYCGSDADTTLKLVLVLENELEKDARLAKLYRELELPLVGVIRDMERRGIGLDTESLRRLENEFMKAMKELEKRASEIVGWNINLNSPSQVSRALFETLGLESAGKTSSGAYSSRMSVLERLRGKHPFVDIVMEHRELAKLLNTYIRKLPSFISARDGLIHTNFSQTVTATGRLSSSRPNLQNIPVRTSRGRRVRECFVPGGRGEVFVTADYSQIELRILAHFAGPGNLRHAFEEGIDVHARTAEALFGDAKPEHRRKAKEVNYSILYGISSWGLAARLNVSRAEASAIIERYMRAYPEVKNFFDACVKKAETEGETRTILGRKRSFQGIKNAKGAERNAMERMAVNTTIQGSAADMIKLAMLNVHRRLTRVEGAGLVLQVHDELVVTTPEKKAGEVEVLLRKEMVNAIPLDVPLRVDTGTGKNWLEALH